MDLGDETKAATMSIARNLCSLSSDWVSSGAAALTKQGGDT